MFKVFITFTDASPRDLGGVSFGAYVLCQGSTVLSSFLLAADLVPGTPRIVSIWLPIASTVVLAPKARSLQQCGSLIFQLDEALEHPIRKTAHVSLH